jgi:hypothetical protein
MELTNRKNSPNISARALRRVSVAVADTSRCRAASGSEAVASAEAVRACETALSGDGEE